MTLGDYLVSISKSPEEFGAEIRVAGETVRRYIRGDRLPRDEIMDRIVEKTEGRVQPNDFYVVRRQVRRPHDRCVA